MSNRNNIFHVEINDGSEQIIITRTGLYWMAVVAALATLDFVEKPINVVKIWVPHLLPEYGPYWYECDGHSISTSRKR